MVLHVLLCRGHRTRQRLHREQQGCDHRKTQAVSDSWCWCSNCLHWLRPFHELTQVNLVTSWQIRREAVSVSCTLIVVLSRPLVRIDRLFHVGIV
jgi:hypothetical protein